MLNIKNVLKSILIIFTGVFFGFKISQKPGDELILKDERLSFVPREFYIKNVVDERKDHTPLASLIAPITEINKQSVIYGIDFYGGTIASVKQFIAHNLPAEKSLRPVIADLKKFSVTETDKGNGMVEGHIILHMSFYLDKSDDMPVHLVDYDGNATYSRNKGPAQLIEPTLRHLLENALVYLNNWMNQQAGTNIKLAKAVIVNFTDYDERPEGDTIYYAFKRPLRWDDFQSKLPSSHFDAEVFPTLGYDEHVDISNSVINIRLSLKVAMPKSAMWVKSGSMNDYTLNHEQRHFDIVKLVAERFKHKIQADTIPVDNFEGIINFDYLDAYRQMNSLQKQYDDETRHGADRTEQERWNEKIDKELRSERELP